MSTPDPVLNNADMSKMKKLSLTIFVVRTGFLLSSRRLQIMQVTTITAKMKYFHTSSLTATNKQGSVIKSPTDVIRGAVTLSGSHPLEKLWTATKRVNTRIHALEMTPPMTDTVTSSTIDIEANPKITAVTRESMAKRKETVNVRKREAAIFCIIRGDRSSFEISPTCSAVLIREPKEAKIFPLMPIAAGTIMISPGSSSSMVENFPR
jgi:hypothetical protein